LERKKLFFHTTNTFFFNANTYKNVSLFFILFFWRKRDTIWEKRGRGRGRGGGDGREEKLITEILPQNITKKV
jgi:hypothetical protein